MASAMGILKWPPDRFWKATVYEYTAAMKGHLVSQGADLEPPVSRDEYLSWKAEEERNKRMTDA